MSGCIRMIRAWIRMIRLQLELSGVLGHISRIVRTGVRIIRASAGSSGQAEPWQFFSSIFLLRFFLSLDFSMVAPEVPEYAKSLR